MKAKKSVEAYVPTEEQTAALKKIEAIMEESAGIKPKKIAEEILVWLTNNVETFIDNHKKMFKLDLVIESASMPETVKLQTLYLDVPPDEIFIPKDFADAKDWGKVSNDKRVKPFFDKLATCRETLDKVTEKAFEKMQQMEEQKQALFKRMAFFYEMVAVKDGEPLFKELVGAVDVLNFEYENFSVDVKIKAPQILVKKGDGSGTEIVSIKDKNYTIQSAFTLWLEIAFSAEPSMTSLF